MRQEFHRGDLVFLRAEYWHDPELQSFSSDPEDTKRVRSPVSYGIIVGSYRDKYGGGPDGRHIYTVLFLDEEGQPQYESSWHSRDRIMYLVQERCIENLDILDFYEERYYADEDWGA